jgi:RNA polymerase sigma-70 factor (ECF subfamily)
VTDDELMKRIARGDQRAFEKLFDRHSGKVFGYARRLIGDETRAEDVSQEVWMKIVKAASSYQPTSQFIAWLFTIVRHTAFNQLRSQKASGHSVDIQDVNETEITLDIERKSVEELLMQKADIKIVKETLDELPDMQRTVLTAWMTEELSYEELARDLGLSLSSVKSLLFRAKQNLEKSLKARLA